MTQGMRIGKASSAPEQPPGHQEEQAEPDGEGEGPPSEDAQHHLRVGGGEPVRREQEAHEQCDAEDQIGHPALTPP